MGKGDGAPANPKRVIDAIGNEPCTCGGMASRPPRCRGDAMPEVGGDEDRRSSGPIRAASKVRDRCVRIIYSPSSRQFLKAWLNWLFERRRPSWKLVAPGPIVETEVPHIQTTTTAVPPSSATRSPNTAAVVGLVMRV